MNKPGRKSAASLAVVPPVLPELPRSNRPEPPGHLSAEASTWWRNVVNDFDLEAHHLHLLQCACEAWDKMSLARREIAAHGSLTFRDNAGNIKSHPANAIERDSRTAFARLVRELDLDAGAPSEARRPPALHSNRRD